MPDQPSRVHELPKDSPCAIRWHCTQLGDFGSGHAAMCIHVTKDHLLLLQAVEPTHAHI